MNPIEFKKAGLPPFYPTDPDCIEILDTYTMITPDFKAGIKTRHLQSIVRLTPFINNMYKILEVSGMQLDFSTKFYDLIFNEKKIIDIKAIKDGEIKEYYFKTYKFDIK